jgi:hypothetical protein
MRLEVEGVSKDVTDAVDRGFLWRRSEAANATATSEGWVATQASDHPKMA